LGRSQQSLGGHAGVERALTANQLALDQGHGKTVIGQAPCAYLSGRPGAEDDYIEVSRAHKQLLTIVQPKHLHPHTLTCSIVSTSVSFRLSSSRIFGRVPLAEGHASASLK
jgi:hypothetical protein